MKIPTKKYANEDLLLLSRKIRESAYIKDVQAVLQKKGIIKLDNYISQVVFHNEEGVFKNYNEDVWDAIVEVLNKRKVERELNAMRVRMAVAD